MMRLRLFYGSFLVGEIDDAFVDQGTWFGSFRTRLSLGELGGIEERLFDYIAFSEAWNTSARSELPHDTSEFDFFADVIGSGLWWVENSDGARQTIEDAPLFFMQSEVSWLLADDTGARRFCE